MLQRFHRLFFYGEYLLSLREHCKDLYQWDFENKMYCGLQIRPVEKQLKQQVIGKRYCISRKRKSYKGSTSRAWHAVIQSNIS